MPAAADEGPAHAVHGVRVDVGVDPIPVARVTTLPQPTAPFVEKELRRRRHWRRATWHRRHASSWQRRRAPTLHRLSHETHNFVDTRRGRLDVEVHGLGALPGQRVQLQQLAGFAATTRRDFKEVTVDGVAAAGACGCAIYAAR